MKTGAQPNSSALRGNGEKQALSLQRENILSQKTSNPGRRAALEAALAQIECADSGMG